MNENQRKRIIHHLAAQRVPGEIDLWPAIREHFETSKQPIFKGDLSMNQTLARRRRIAGTFLLALLLVTALLLATPQGRAWAQNVLQFFSRAEADSLPVQSWQMTPAPQADAPDPANILDANQPVAAVEQQAGFNVLEPTWLPENFTFSGASLEAEHKIARLFYQYLDTNGVALREEPFKQADACELCGVVGESAAVETVQIGNHTGEYVQGVWKLTDAGPVWEADPYLQTIRWQANGIAFELLYMGPPEDLAKADLIKIAESLK